MEYAEFNLLLGTSNQLWHHNFRDVVLQLIEAGLCGMSNARLNSLRTNSLQATPALADSTARRPSDLSDPSSGASGALIIDTDNSKLIANHGFKPLGALGCGKK